MVKEILARAYAKVWDMVYAGTLWRCPQCDALYVMEYCDASGARVSRLNAARRQVLSRRFDVVMLCPEDGAALEVFR